MEENLNQIVPSTSYDWLDHRCHDEDESNNQVVPVTAPAGPSPPSLPSGVERFTAVSRNEQYLSSSNKVADNDLLLSPRVEKYAQKPVRMLAVEESLKALSLEGIQVVPSASKSPTMETLAMNVDFSTGTSSSKFYRSTSKATVQNV